MGKTLSLERSSPGTNNILARIGQDVDCHYSRQEIDMRPEGMPVGTSYIRSTTTADISYACN